MRNQQELQQIGEQQRVQYVCLFCSERASMEEHIRQCRGISPDLLHQKPTFFRVMGRGNLCKNCWCLFSQRDWQYHRKAQVCHRIRSSLFLQRDMSQQQVRPQSLPAGPTRSIEQSNNLQYFSEGHTRLQHNRNSTSQTEKYHLQMIAIITSVLSPLIHEWMARNQHVDINVLVVYLTSAILDFGTNFLAKPIIVPSWKDIQRKVGKSLPWMAILERPQNLFNQRFIDGKLERMTPQKQLRVIKSLNRLSNFYKGLIKKRQLPTFNRIPRAASFVNIRDILLLIRSLFECRKKQVVHFALDLYLILLIGMRFLADRLRIEKGVLEMLAGNRAKETQDLQLTFPMVIGKTGQQQEVCINRQLCLLLLEFGWSGFHPKTKRLVQRMKGWLGINGYSFKDALLNAASKVATNLGLAQSIAGHKSVANTRRYTQLTTLADTLRVTRQLVIPGLNALYGAYDDNQVIEYLNSLVVSQLRYTKFLDDWLPRLLSMLYTTRYQSQYQNDLMIDYMKQQLVPQEPPQQQQVHHLERRSINMEASSSSEDGESNQSSIQFQQSNQNEKIIIYGIQVSFKSKIFQTDIFFQKVVGYETLSCASCMAPILPGKIRHKCIYCTANTHQTCSQNICNCTRAPMLLQQAVIPLLGKISISKHSHPKILMPTQYMRVGTKQEQAIKILCTLRSFRYTRVPMASPGYALTFPEQYWKGVKQLKLSEYSQYINGAYFPPIEALPTLSYQPHAVFGVQWGIFATESIGKNVLIGEYACDLLQGKNLFLCKKADSIMMFSGNNTPEDVFLAPKDFSGYVTLVNTGSQQMSNCQTLRVIIKGELRILLITTKKISIGEELLYQYGAQYKFEQ